MDFIASLGQNLLDHIVVADAADHKMLGPTFYKRANKVDYLIGGSTLASLKLSHRYRWGAVVIFKISVDSGFGLDSIVHD
jgi:hypothetical protein